MKLGKWKRGRTGVLKNVRAILVLNMRVPELPGLPTASGIHRSVRTVKVERRRRGAGGGTKIGTGKHSADRNQKEFLACEN